MKRRSRTLLLLAVSIFGTAIVAPQCAILSAPGAGAGGHADVRFNRDVWPILSDRCFHCHGRDAGNRKAGLRLDQSSGAFGAYRIRKGKAAIRPGSLRDSAMWQRLTATDPHDAMPPPNSHKKRLDAQELAILRDWILQGAKYEAHWAFLPLARSAPADRRPRGDRIDGFVRQRLAESGLEPSPPADRRTLIRRVTFDLTGLPPTRDEIRTFLADETQGAWERLVDRLLAKLQYGEHMARYWLDLVRFADTNGMHHDHFRNMSLYRDWVIRAFNANLPYDEFVTDQLAGDQFPQPTDDQLIASGYNRLHLIIDRGTALPEESYTKNVVDRVTAFGTAFLGLTLGCAVCHDHKYDPFGQKDFYQLFAFFNNLDGAPETGARGTIEFRRGLQPPYIEFATEEEDRTVAELSCEHWLATERVADVVERQEIAKKAAEKKKARTRADDVANDGKPDGKPDSAQSGAKHGADAGAKVEKPTEKDDAMQKELAAAQKEERRLRAARDAILLPIPAAMVMKERADIRPAHILVRGVYDHPGAAVQRDAPAFLPPLHKVGKVATRLDLARWLMAPKNPLAARVVVNRIWQQFFGVGIVKTAEDFGTQGERPSHPDLLDWLAVSFVDSGWDVKALVKRIVMSKTYRQSSVVTLEQSLTDPENRRLARGSRFRMDAEMIRDQILATSGLLNPRMYGPSVKPPQPAGIWRAVSLPDSFPRIFKADTGDAIYRRSLYTFWKRGLPPPQMTLLNAPTREYCTARRERTNTPLQALLLWNEGEYLHAARHLAHRTLVDEPERERLRCVYETITSQLPDEDETAALRSCLLDMRRIYDDDPDLAAKLCAGVTLEPGITAPELAAWTMLTSTIYNLDVTRTRQ